MQENRQNRAFLAKNGPNETDKQVVKGKEAEKVLKQAGPPVRWNQMGMLGKYIALGLVLALAVGTSCKKKDDGTALDWSAQLLASGSFTDLGNGSVQAVSTGLIWTKCTIGQSWNGTLNNCTGTGSGTVYGAASKAFCSVDFENGCIDNNTLVASSGPAFDSCAALGNGYRLPTIFELEAFANTVADRNTLLIVFPQTPDDKPFWSGSQNTSQTSGKEARVVFFAENTFGQTDSFNKASGVAYVRCVR